MKIELWKLSDVKPYPNNPRLNDDAVDAVAASIREFGFRQPIVVDDDGVIIVGHTRYKAAQKLGLEKVPVHVAVDLTPAQVKAYRIADNQTARVGRMGSTTSCRSNWPTCRRWTSTSTCSASTRTNWPSCSTATCSEGLTDPDDVPEPPDEATTQPGDLWILGDHRLLCGDSSKPEDVDRLLDGATIHLVNTDPPYNVKVEPRSQQRHRRRPQLVPRHHAPPEASTWQRHPEKAKPTHKKLRAKDRPLANDFVSDEEFDRLAGCLVRQHGPRAAAGPRASTSGAATPTSATTRRA